MRAGTPLFGICLGMQWLFEGSDEAPEVPGLGVLPGRVARLRGNAEAATEDSACRLECSRDCTRVRRSAARGSRHRRRPCVLHALVRRAGDSRLRRRDDACRIRSRRSSSATTCSACSSTRRSRAIPACRSSATSSTVSARRMLTKRIIACMDVRDGQVVKGVQFQQLRHAGDPASSRSATTSKASTRSSCSTSPRRSKAARRWRARSTPSRARFSAADRGRRHPLRRRCGGGRRCGRRQGQPQHRGAAQPRR